MSSNHTDTSLYPTESELVKITEISEKLEAEAVAPYKAISGGFAKAEMYEYDENTFELELKFGVQSDVADSVHSEYHSIDRKTMELTT